MGVVCSFESRFNLCDEFPVGVWERDVAVGLQRSLRLLPAVGVCELRELAECPLCMATILNFTSFSRLGVDVEPFDHRGCRAPPRSRKSSAARLSGEASRLFQQQCLEVLPPWQQPVP
eukprot:CAMPEP_0173382748 /NCGR_PEP_ID=MMETSP1356-20130122/5281_1 /TAXON_ID=77927 ORGANISM="Hemiselmis virescens, Strain PCC157" /NCGR_SAMPLE_ID=MMETSP1356 /ASSEMBLY_ACC=CAM_ASM_000847 /LENGTH=117 /DNA_ID=CAMNT_0014337271 /DNA_START=50 /DNA_END=399 /DNA_ORIENTATION=-